MCAAVDTAAQLAEVGASLADGLLPVQVFSDPGLYEQEIERIFLRAWVYLGHESEIPARGDYVKRQMGRDAFVLVRGEDDEIRVLFDSCRHRGALVCRADQGNAGHFRCPYHGWTYKNTGELVGAPFMRPAYGGDLDKARWGLFKAPHVESVHGFVFASLDEEAPPLDDYLGGFRWQMDAIWGQCAKGWEVVGDPQRFIVPANWKTGADNFCGDDYHTFYLHRSTIGTGIMEGVQGGDLSENLAGYHVQGGNGHAISHFLTPQGTEENSFWAYPPEVQSLFTGGAGGPELLDVARRSVGCVGTIFPNFSFLSFPLSQSKEMGPTTTMTIRVWQPRGPGEMEVWSWVLCPVGTPEPFRTQTYRATIGTFSAGGTFEQDDSEPWIAMGRTASTSYGRKVGMKLNYQMGMSGTGDSQRVDDYPGPGVAYYPVLEEGVHRGFHRRWLQFMQADGYPSTMSPADQDGEGRDG